MNENLEKRHNAPEITEREVKGLFSRLNPRDQLSRLMLLLDMPRDIRPSDELTIAEREGEIISWAGGENGPSLERLAEEIEKLVQKQQG